MYPNFMNVMFDCIQMFYKNRFGDGGGGEDSENMVQQLRAHTTLSENLNFAPSTQQLITPDPTPFSDFVSIALVCVHTHAHKNTHKHTHTTKNRNRPL